MVSRSCIRLVQLYFQQWPELKLVKVELGKVELICPDKFPEEKLINLFKSIGFTLAGNPDDALVESIKRAAIELIHQANNANSLIRNSDYISERLQMPYNKISKHFSDNTSTTLEKYIILLKIEKTKELLVSGDYTLSEISYMLGYSSVQYLSNQFKKITGKTVSGYKKNPEKERIALEDLLN